MKSELIDGTIIREKSSMDIIEQFDKESMKD
jgi:hypothetical protein